MAVKVVSDENFQETVQEGLVLVDFWAEWCGPCKMIAPLVEELSSEMQEVIFAKMNIDDNHETPQKFGITAIPTLLLYKDGEVIDSLRGLVPKPQLAAFVQKHLN